MYSNPAQWRRLKERVLVRGESIRSVAKREGMSRNTLKRLLALDAPPRYMRRNGMHSNSVVLPAKPAVQTRADVALQRWKDWLYMVERGDLGDDPLNAELSGRSAHARKLVLAAMARNHGFSDHVICKHLGLAPGTVRKHLAAFDAEGVPGLLGRKQRPKRSSDSAFTSALFTLLHEPPALSGFNRTTWRMADRKRGLTALWRVDGVVTKIG
jgi:transposase